MSSPRVLGYGIDTLVVNLYWPDGAYQLPDDIEDTLDSLKELYRRDPEGAIFWGIDAYFPLPNPSDHDRLFEAAVVQPTRHYAWQLSFGGLVFVRLSSVKDTTQRRDFPAMRVEFTGTYMLYADRDANAVVEWVLRAAENLTGVRPERVQVSRADVFVDIDVEPGTFQIEDLHRFTSRSHVRGFYSLGGAEPGEAGPAPQEGPMSNTPPQKRLEVPGSWVEGLEQASAFVYRRQWSGFVFGRGPLMARVYSKSVEATVKPATRYLLAMYEELGDEPLREVVRVEFQLTTEALREMVVEGDGTDLRDWDTFLWALPSVWAYLTGAWLVLRDGDRAHRYGRLRDVPVDPVWVRVQRAFGEGGDRRKLVRDRLFRRVDPVALAKQAMGAFLTALVAAAKFNVSFRDWWVGAFRALGSDMDERERLAKEASVAYTRSWQRKLAAVGLMPEKWAFGGVPG
ncbi:hypothetical protein [Thermus caldifontis]|uniref:hypothetical protein n=1 Tax=Thermus caldifontis TaxID=1930763 RepID=UPI000DF2530A|nr:hypothetical protein [Thermus caldifontis]